MTEPDFAIKSALTEGALEVYDYLLELSEDDLNVED